MRSVRLYATGLLLLLPIGVLAFVLFRYSVNVPWFDDFDPFPDFIRHWNQSDSFSAQLKVLFQPNNEHRMVTAKAITLVHYLLTGMLNISALLGYGFLFSVAAAGVMSYALHKAGYSPVYTLPLPFFLFQVQPHLVFLWAICSLQHQTVIFFVVLSMYWLTHSDRLYWAVIAAVLASFSMSNGLFVWVGGGAVLLLMSRYRALTVWIVAAVFSFLAYFNGMTTQGNEASIAYFKSYPQESLAGFFAFLGGLFDLVPQWSIQYRVALPILMAALLCLGLGILMVKLLREWLGTFRDGASTLLTFRTRTISAEARLLYFGLGVFVFLLTNAIIIGLLRPRFGFFVMVVSNYKLYPALFLAMSYLVYLQMATRYRKQVLWGFSTVAVFIWLFSFVHHFPSLKERRNYLLANAYNQAQHGFGLGHQPGSEAALYVDQLMGYAVAKGYYRFPTTLNPLIARIQQEQSVLAEAAQFEIRPIAEGLAVSNNDYTPRPYERDEFVYVFLRQAGNVYLFKMEPRPYRGLNLLRSYAKGLDVVIPQAIFTGGPYELGVLIRSGDSLSCGLLQQAKTTI